MKSIFSQIFKSSLFNHVMRLAIICMLLSYSVLAAADDWKATSTVTVKVAATGHGKVYANQENTPTSSADYQINMTSKYQETLGVTTTEKTYKHKLCADPEDGYYLDGWYKGDYSVSIDGLPTATSKYNPYVHEQTSYNLGDYKNPSEIFTAVFKEQVVYKNYARVVAVIVDSDNKPLMENGFYTTGSCYVSIGASKTPTAPTDETGDHKITELDSNPKGEWKYTYNASANPNNYDFLGWYQSDDGNLPLTNGKVGTPTYGNAPSFEKSYPTEVPYSDKENAPEAKIMYAVFKPKLFLYSYQAEEDKFEEQPMSNTVSDGIFKYTDRPENYRGGDRLYKIVHNYTTPPTVCDYEGDFTAQIEQIQGSDVLRVTPTSNADELTGTVSLCLDGSTKVVQLTIEVSNTPIYVTLNPAVDLLGTYTYTQNTTGAQQFEVTTSPIQKKMTTSSDYAFTFNPTPRDPDKMMFEKWVIRDGAGNVIYESETANLTYRFSGGESIAPTFTSKDRAIFIVKSEPNVKYLKLQEALNRASSLKQSTGQNQVVTVYMKDPGLTNPPLRLVQGNYTIENGVTFLIPGESSLAVIEAPNEDNYIISKLSTTTFCTLIADDNTTITVNNGGKISLYARMGADQGASGIAGKVFNHGHLQLGKDCQIVVNTGGFLYALGFITGDMSSHITMKTGSTVYESFQFKDWRGGSVVMEMMGNEQKVMPVGQYYAQTVEVPMTLEWGAKEYLSTAVSVSGMGIMAANVKFIDTYTKVYDDFDGLGLFALDQDTKLTKSYDPATDRLKIRMEGSGVSTQVKIGHLQLKMKPTAGGLGGIIGGLTGGIDVDSKDYVMPIQNNMDVEVKNATINITNDLAFMPGSSMRVYDDAVINVESGVRMYIYDGDARVTNAGNGYWGDPNATIIPLDADARPGGIQHKRTEAELVDARLIINGDMNIHGELYTVKGPTDIENGAGGDISSEGSGKINVYNIGTDKITYQWHKANKAQEVSLTTPSSLILHNDLSKQPEGAKKEYTAVVNTNNVNLAETPLSYTYYQHDGTWRLPEAGITGIKLYDSNGTEIEKFLITRPDVASVSGYILATLEPMTGVDYQPTDFNITSGDYSLNKYATIENGKLKISLTYPVQKIHGDHTQTLSIVSSESAEFSCAINVEIKATEDYTPIFEVPTSLSIFGRISEPTDGALPIKHDAENVVVVTETSSTNPTNPEWVPVIEGADKDYFEFSLGEDGNKLDGAKVIFTANNGTTRNATLKLRAIYTDENGTVIPSEEHSVTLVGNGLMTENTLAFNNVGTITTKTNPFELLAYINSEGKIYYEIVEGAVNDEEGAIIAIEPIDETDINGNYRITPKKVGQVKIRVYQEGTDTHTAIGMTYNSSTGKWVKGEGAMEKTIVVVADPGALTEDNSCIEGETDFQSLTADMQNVTYDGTENKIHFTGATSSTWVAQFSNMPGVLTFTPYGNGYWAIQESKDGVDWTETSIWWTQLPSEKPITVALRPTSRRVQISYLKETKEGAIEDVCIKPFAIHSDVTKIYVPVVNGQVQRTEVVFTHTTPSAAISEGPTWATAQSTTSNLGGVLNTYYQTTIVLEGSGFGSNVAELNDGYTLTVATDGLGEGQEEEASVVISTYDFPKELPMQSSTWVTNNAVDNINDYDESEHYYWYMTDARYVKWDAERKNVVFLSKGNNEGVRSVTFGYDGLPSEVRFQSLATEWIIEESSDNTWPSDEVTPSHSTTTVDGVNTIKQSILHTSKYVRITYVGDNPNEVLLSNLEIEGFPSAVPDNMEVEISKGDDPNDIPAATFKIHVMNLDRMQLHLDNSEFKMYYQAEADESWEELENTDILDNEFSFLAMNKEGDITIKVEWYGENLVNEGHIQILNPDKSNKEMAIVRLVGKKSDIRKGDAKTGIWTGVPKAYSLVGSTGDNKVFEPYPYHEVDLTNAFDTDGKALFDYVVVYGETTTKDGELEISRPNSSEGSNAKTPYYIYERSKKGDSYTFIQAVENANSKQKANLSELSHYTVAKTENGVDYYAIMPDEGIPLSMYITGFCPYATTGSSKDDEGVWYFQGKVDDQLHVYLEDCHIYSRNKSVSGHITSKNGEDSPYFNSDVVLGSGAVLVFENADPEQDNTSAFKVSIHTRGHNILKSNYGCYYQFIGTMQATQISSPIQVRLGEGSHFNIARTTLDFDDIWPIDIDDRSEDKRTNGFLSLQKLANNAPSIDLGNAHTVVNFRGGQVQLQNATIGSPNYKTTLAISHRSGKMGNIGIQMAYGIGTDDVGGEVNFYDGTTTVLPMKVEDVYSGYYLMDEDDPSTSDKDESRYTSCLRTPTKTYVYGGSHCMMRACNLVTSKGGAPKDGPTGVPLGRYVHNNYKYTCAVETLPEGNLYEQGYREGYELIYNNTRYVVDLENNSWIPLGPASSIEPCYLAVPTNFPGNLTYKGALLSDYYADNYPKNQLTDKGEYGLSSITPDADGNLSFWIPEGVVEGVNPETDKTLTGWKASMTEIAAGNSGYSGRIGGQISIEFDEEVRNLLYCQLDRNIYNLIHDRTEIGVDEDGEPIYDYTYTPPVVDPTGQLQGEDRYQTVDILHIGDSVQHSIYSPEDYIVTNKIYYVTTAQADKWMNFTMPFDVEKVWIVESYSESEIEGYFENYVVDGELTKRDATLKFQARHNADFATFFGVAMAIGNDAQSFENIYATYMDWAQNKADRDNGLYSGEGNYSLRGKYPLTHYNGSNFTSAHFYLYKNVSDWAIREEAGNSDFVTHWQIVPKVSSGGVLMEAGATYSMLFPYCMGCDVEIDESGKIKEDEYGLPVIVPRTYWDYWSGKFLIFESTTASEKHPHVIKGSNYVRSEKSGESEWIFDDMVDEETSAKLMGNPTFTMLHVNDLSTEMQEKIYVYDSDTYYEGYYPIERVEDDDKNMDGEITEDEKYYPFLTPATTFLLHGSASKPKMITRDGRIIRGDDNNGNQNGTSGHMPTVGGGNDLFITSIAGGVNVAVAAPQNVRVLSSTGAVIYSGYIQTAVDIKLPTNGIYIVSGENEVQKILY